MSANMLIPVRPEIQYLPHQEVGIRWMLAREDVGASVCRGGILGDDMGLGKTFQTIGLLKNGAAMRTLIVCPPALIAGWKEELKACGYLVQTLMGSHVWSHPTVTDVNTTIWLTSYPKISQYAEKLGAFERVVLDEAHARRVVAAVLEALQAIDEDLHRLPVVAARRGSAGGGE